MPVTSWLLISLGNLTLFPNFQNIYLIYFLVCTVDIYFKLLYLWQYHRIFHKVPILRSHIVTFSSWGTKNPFNEKGANKKLYKVRNQLLHTFWHPGQINNQWCKGNKISHADFQGNQHLLTRNLSLKLYNRKEMSLIWPGTKNFWKKIKTRPNVLNLTLATTLRK